LKKDDSEEKMRENNERMLNLKGIKPFLDKITNPNLNFYIVCGRGEKRKSEREIGFISKKGKIQYSKRWLILISSKPIVG